MASRTGARILVDQLLIQGVNHAFCVPESYLPVLDALYDAREMIKLIVNRHESGATFMAEAYAKLTGQPGVVMVTRGPGATNTSIGVHTAFRTPRRWCCSSARWATTSSIAKPSRRSTTGACSARCASGWRRSTAPHACPEAVARAFKTATSGRPGPVVLALPEDMLVQQADVGDALCHQPVQAAPSDTQVAAMRRLLGRAQRRWSWREVRAGPMRPATT